MQVIAAGDLCAICQEKMHTPVLLRCKHIFCEDCVSEWLVFSSYQVFIPNISSNCHSLFFVGGIRFLFEL